MSEHTAKRLAWTCWAVTVAFIGAELFVGHLKDPSSTSLLSSAFSALVGLAFATVGLLIASRRRGNLIGWVLATGTLLSAISGFMLGYSEYAVLTAHGSVAIALWSAVLGGWFRTIGFILMLFVVLLLFPDGHLPSPRWRWVARLFVFTLVLNTIGPLFDPDMSDIDQSLSSFSNPLSHFLPQPVASALAGLSLPLLGATMIASVAAIVVRFRRSKGDERQQLKWLTYSSFFSGAIFVVVLVGALLNLDFTASIGGFLFELLLIPIPIAVGIAILKYRLYDIDIIINRTLVYGALTGSLALIYFGSIVLLETLLRPVTGQGHNDLVIVASTLLIATLFLPLRGAIQGFIDRRFYRRKYDAARTLEAFSTTLRDEVDLAALSGRVVGVVEETMQPAHVSLWLRESRRGEG